MPFYIVRKGKNGNRGICDDWTSHAGPWTQGVSGAIFKGYKTLALARQALEKAGWSAADIEWAANHLNQPLPGSADSDDEEDSDEDDEAAAQRAAAGAENKEGEEDTQESLQAEMDAVLARMVKLKVKEAIMQPGEGKPVKVLAKAEKEANSNKAAAQAASSQGAAKPAAGPARG